MEMPADEGHALVGILKWEESDRLRKALKTAQPVVNIADLL